MQLQPESSDASDCSVTVARNHYVVGGVTVVSSSDDEGDGGDESMAHTHPREVGVRHHSTNPSTQTSCFSQNLTRPLDRSEHITWALCMDDLLHNVSQTLPSLSWFPQATPPQPTSEPAAAQQRAGTTVQEQRWDGPPFSARGPSEARPPLTRWDGPLSARLPLEVPHPLPRTEGPFSASVPLEAEQT
jgi:hypothetical protein